MYYKGPPGTMVDLSQPSPNGADVLYDHAYVYARNNPVRFIDPSGLIACAADGPCTKVKAKKSCSGLAPKELPDSKTIYGITYCEDGEIKIKIYPPEDGVDETNNKLRGDKCFKKCVEVHEAYHKKQIQTWCPDICPCFKEDHGAGPFDVAYADKKTENTWECPTLRLTIQCLRDAIAARTPGCDLGLINDKMIRTIRDYRNKGCPGTWEDRVPPIPEFPFGD